MSLTSHGGTCLVDYSSEVEQEEERAAVALSDKEDEEDEKAHIQDKSYKPFDFPSHQPIPLFLQLWMLSRRILEVVGPPEFLNNSVAEYASKIDIDQNDKRGWHKTRKEKKDLLAGAVVEAKTELVGIHDRVRSDIDGSATSTSAACHMKGNLATTVGEGKRAISASNPDAKDAADLLRMCLHCGVPKSYSSARGMACPLCSDRPLADANDS